MPIAYQCACGSRLEAPERDAGKIRRCPDCGMTGQVPDRGSEPPRKGQAELKPAR